MGGNSINFSDIHVAYFSMEIGIDSRMPTYSGGLGLLAGDTLRSCVDLEVPVIGITLLYDKGYFRQRLDSEGNQTEEDVLWDPKAYMVRLPNKILVEVEDRTVTVGAWLYKLKGISGVINPIILLDTNLPENSEFDSTITSHLYGNNERYRLAQEMILGIGGIRMIRDLGCSNIEKHHMNEGHSALLSLELFRDHSEHKDPIHELRKKCVFTTHTPVPAGHDQFSRELSESMLKHFLTDTMRSEFFLDGKLNMTYLGLRASRYINGVAKKHSEISRTMFPGYHIESITNGIHSLFWCCEPFKALYDKYIPLWYYDPFALRSILSIPKTEVWEAHIQAKRSLLSFINKKHGLNMQEDVFTIGFARRAAAYKRADLLLHDLDRLINIARNSKGIQVIFAGKAHPKDEEAKGMIKNIFQKIKSISNEIQCCYVENYDIGIAKMMVSGVDVWLNTPQRPKEASGTSGMKAALNGVPHLSILDGWWLEGHIENVTGWSIGPSPKKTKLDNYVEDAEDLYTKLQYIILPKFYEHRDEWIETMKHAIALNASFFNTHRMVQQYVLNAYFK